MNERKKRPDIIRQSGPKAASEWLFILPEFVLLAYFSRIMGVRGMSFFGLPALIYMIMNLFGKRGILVSVRDSVRLYKARDDYSGGLRHYRIVTWFFTILHLIVTAIVAIFSKKISILIFGTAIGSYIIIGMMVIYLFRQIVLCIQGFLEGMGVTAASLVTDVVTVLLSLAAAFILAPRFSSYASSISALMRDDNWYYALMAFWAVVSVFAGHVIGFIVMIVLYLGMRKRLDNIFSGGGKRKKIPAFSIISSVYENGFINGGVRALSSVILIIAFVVCRPGEEAEGLITINPEYPGLVFLSFFMMAGPVLLLASQIGDSVSKQAAREKKRMDMPGMREGIALGFKIFTYFTFAYLTALMTMSTSVSKLMFDIEQPLFSRFMVTGIWQVIVFGFVIIMSDVMNRVSGKLMPVVMIVFSLLAEVVMLVLAKGAKQPPKETYIFIILLVSSLAAFIPGALYFYKKLRYKNDLLRIFVLTFVSSVLMGLLAYIFQRFVYDFGGCVAVLLLGSIFGGIAYVTSILMTHTFDMHEWRQVPINGLAKAISRWLKIY